MLQRERLFTHKLQRWDSCLSREGWVRLETGGGVQGAWGFWYLPGTPSFHVYWTGVAEVLGGVGVTLGATHLPFVPDWLLPASGFGLFLLTAVVTPANLYMWTHNSPGPTPEETLQKTGGVIPLQGHLFRALLQVVLLSTFLGLAFPPN